MSNSGLKGVRRFIIAINMINSILIKIKITTKPKITTKTKISINIKRAISNR